MENLELELLETLGILSSLAIWDLAENLEHCETLDIVMNFSSAFPLSTREGKILRHKFLKFLKVFKSMNV